MSIDASEIQQRIESELSTLKDSSVLLQIRGAARAAGGDRASLGLRNRRPNLSVLNRTASRAFGYGDCLFVSSALARGRPWGLVSDSWAVSMGMDSGWFQSFSGAYFD